MCALRGFLEKVIQHFRAPTRRASIAFVSTNADFHHKGTLALMIKMLAVKFPDPLKIGNAAESEYNENAAVI